MKKTSNRRRFSITVHVDHGALYMVEVFITRAQHKNKTKTLLHGPKFKKWKLIFGTPEFLFLDTQVSSSVASTMETGCSGAPKG